MKTKIIATIGPASSSREALNQLIDEGVDVFRLNFSHGKYDDHEAVINNINHLNEEKGKHIATLADLGGPKIRLGEIEDGMIEINAGDRISIATTLTTPGNKNIIGINYQGFATDVDPGQKILIDDGKMQFRVIETNKKDTVQVEALNTGLLKSRKGVNLPDTGIRLPSLTDKDKADLEFILKNKIQWIALSFVRSADDIIELKKLLEDRNSEFVPGIIAKIEKPEAIRNLDQIIEASDALMVARGDLGIEIPIEQVPVLQKKIINRCIMAGKPVIVATQMMEGMIENIFPTRAEVNDVANAVFDGADAVMLSGETSVGKYPVETVRTMSKIIQTVENSEDIYFRTKPKLDDKSADFISDSIVFSAVDLAHETNASAIIGTANSGYSAIRISAHRPKSSIHIFSSRLEVLKKLNLVWGIQTHLFEDHIHPNHLKSFKTLLASKHLIKKGDLVIDVTVYPSNSKDKANLIALNKV